MSFVEKGGGGGGGYLIVGAGSRKTLMLPTLSIGLKSLLLFTLLKRFEGVFFLLKEIFLFSDPPGKRVSYWRKKMISLKNIHPGGWCIYQLSRGEERSYNISAG